jgi:hypothetical protein
MHLNKPTAIATEREVYEVLGAEWARIRRLDQETQWEEIQGEVQKFLMAVREHTGLFVERAPKRYGFMHLTFEEYYAARYLVIRRRDTAKLIRHHLHDSRWEEPILLALGFVGLDYPDEAAELVETAILAQGEEAATLGFQPSQYEDLLGRDYLFALRCLGDQIPVDVLVMQQLIDRLAEEILHNHGLAQFDRYKQAIGERLAYMPGSSGADLFINHLLLRLQHEDIYSKTRAIMNLTELKYLPSELVRVTLDMLNNEDGNVRIISVVYLGNIIGNLNKQDQISTDALTGLQIALSDTEAFVRGRAAHQLRKLGHVSPEVIETLEALLYVEDKACRLPAMSDLKDLAQTSDEIIQRLYSTLLTEDKITRSLAALILGEHGEKSSKVIDALLESLHNLGNVRFIASRQLGVLGQDSPQVLQGLLTKLFDSESAVRSAALAGLHFLNQPLPEVIQAFLNALTDSDQDIRHLAAGSLQQLARVDPKIIFTLKEVLQSQNKYAQALVAGILSTLGHLSLNEIDTLLDLLKFQDLFVQKLAAECLISSNQLSDNLIVELLDLLYSKEQNTRILAAIILGKLEQRLPEVKNQILIALDNNEVDLQGYIANRLIEMNWLLPEAIAALQEVVKHTSNDEIRTDAIVILGQRGQPDEATLSLLQQFLFYSNDLGVEKFRIGKFSVADSCSEALVQLSKRYPNSISTIETLLIQTIYDPVLAQKENTRLGKNQVYKTLWQMVTG